MPRVAVSHRTNETLQGKTALAYRCVLGDNVTKRALSLPAHSFAALGRLFDKVRKRQFLCA